MKDLPLKDLAYMGGWKDFKTLVECYQQPDEDRMREALAQRRPFHATLSIQAVSTDSLTNRTG